MSPTAVLNVSLTLHYVDISICACEALGGPRNGGKVQIIFESNYNFKLSI